VTGPEYAMLVLTLMCLVGIGAYVRDYARTLGRAVWGPTSGGEDIGAAETPSGITADGVVIDHSFWAHVDLQDAPDYEMEIAARLADAVRQEAATRQDAAARLDEAAQMQQAAHPEAAAHFEELARLEAAALAEQFAHAEEMSQSSPTVEAARAA
jgi:hypothetical protein